MPNQNVFYGPLDVYRHLDRIDMRQRAIGMAERVVGHMGKEQAQEIVEQYCGLYTPGVLLEGALLQQGMPQGVVSFFFQI